MRCSKSPLCNANAPLLKSSSGRLSARVKYTASKIEAKAKVSVAPNPILINSCNDVSATARSLANAIRSRSILSVNSVLKSRPSATSNFLLIDFQAVAGSVPSGIGNISDNEVFKVSMPRVSVVRASCLFECSSNANALSPSSSRAFLASVANFRSSKDMVCCNCNLVLLSR